MQYPGESVSLPASLGCYAGTSRVADLFGSRKNVPLSAYPFDTPSSFAGKLRGTGRSEILFELSKKLPSAEADHMRIFRGSLKKLQLYREKREGREVKNPVF